MVIMNTEAKVQKEVWKPVKRYEDKYQVSNLGRVRSVDRVITYKHSLKGLASSKHKGRVLKQLNV